MNNSYRTRIVIMGAAGRDFHNFNVVYRDEPACEVVAFTAAQIPGIAARRYPAVLAGPLYPEGISIVPEAELEALIRAQEVEQVVFAYSDIAHVEVMHLASRALAAGADFTLLGPQRTMIAAGVPVIAVSAVRTGCGKSPVSRWLTRELAGRGLRAAVVRHPMPYGDLARQSVQRFAARADLERAACSLEEREEYEPHLAAGNIVYAGVDYVSIIELAGRDADIILWDGGNNDFPFVRPDLHIVLADPLRPGHECAYHPGETVLRMADVVLLAKADSAAPGALRQVTQNARRANPRAPIVCGSMPARLDDAAAVRGKRVLVVEDGPTITHGGMSHGAGLVAALQAGAAAIVDPRAAAAPEIAAVYARYPHIGPVLPATGYTPAQLEALRKTINDAHADVVVAATPIDLAALIALDKPVVRARYEYVDSETPGLAAELDRFLSGRAA
ncbi:MAG: cyclic 2,3-diphosphoglycerate synthase [Burkholderiales bacterium]